MLIVCGIRIEIRIGRLNKLTAVIGAAVVVVNVEDAVHIVVDDIVNDLLNAAHPLIADLIGVLIHFAAPRYRNAHGIEACRLDGVDQLLGRQRVAPALLPGIRGILIIAYRLCIQRVAEIPAELQMLRKFHCCFTVFNGLVEIAVEDAALEHCQVNGCQTVIVVEVTVCGNSQRAAHCQIGSQCFAVIQIDLLVIVDIALSCHGADVQRLAGHKTDLVDGNGLKALVLPELEAEFIRNRPLLRNLDDDGHVLGRMLDPYTAAVPVIVAAAGRIISDDRHRRLVGADIGIDIEPDLLDLLIRIHAEIGAGVFGSCFTIFVFEFQLKIDFLDIVAARNVFGCQRAVG